MFKWSVSSCRLSGKSQTSCAGLVRVHNVVALWEVGLYDDWSSNVLVCVSFLWRLVFTSNLGGVYMRKLAPVWVSYRYDFLILYRGYRMTGLFHIWSRYLKVHFMLIKCTHDSKSRTLDWFHTETGGCFMFTWYCCEISYWSEILAPVRQPEWTHPGRLVPAWLFVVVSCKQM